MLNQGFTLKTLKNKNVSKQKGHSLEIVTQRTASC